MLADRIRPSLAGSLSVDEGGIFQSPVFNGRNYRGLNKVKEALVASGRREIWGKVIVNVVDRKRSRL